MTTTFKSLVTSTAMVMALSMPSFAAESVSVDTFVRAESDRTLQAYVDAGAFGEFFHFRDVTPIDKQDVIRMNRDTVYSVAVLDLADPATIIKPESGGRFMSMLVINQDHSMMMVEHGSGEFELTEDGIGTRYALVLLRTFIDPNDPADIDAVAKLQNSVTIEQSDVGSFEVPDWDLEDLDALRSNIQELAMTVPDQSGFFGKKSELDPIQHLLGTAFGWGANPPEAALYSGLTGENTDGKQNYAVTLKDVPVDGFWSITMYNKDGYMEENDQDAYSFNNVIAVPNEDGTITINAGGCEDGRVNCLPITEGWNTLVRLYQPQQVILDGEWTFPAFEAVD